MCDGVHPPAFLGLGLRDARFHSEVRRTGEQLLRQCHPDPTGVSCEAVRVQALGAGEQHLPVVGDGPDSAQHTLLW